MIKVTDVYIYIHIYIIRRYRFVYTIYNDSYFTFTYYICKYKGCGTFIGIGLQYYITHFEMLKFTNC